MVSTKNSAGWPAASIALRISAIGERHPVEVSLCRTQTALISLFLSLRRWSAIAVGSAPMREQPLLDHVLDAARREWSSAVLLLRGQFLAQPCHRPIEMMQIKPRDARNRIVLAPAIRRPVGA